MAGRSVRISSNKVDEYSNKRKDKPFPTTEVIELRRLADEYKVKIVLGAFYIASSGLLLRNVPQSFI